MTRDRLTSAEAWHLAGFVVMGLLLLLFVATVVWALVNW